MTPESLVVATSHFERDLKKLVGRHPEIAEHYANIIGILKADPYNRTRSHAIKRLEAVSAGEGQYRIRAGHFRFRYDIEGQVVYLKACGLRREDTYR